MLPDASRPRQLYSSFFLNRLSVELPWQWLCVYCISRKRVFSFDCNPTFNCTHSLAYIAVSSVNVETNWYRFRYYKPNLRAFGRACDVYNYRQCFSKRFVSYSEPYAVGLFKGHTKTVCEKTLSAGIFISAVARVSLIGTQSVPRVYFDRKKVEFWVAL